MTYNGWLWFAFISDFTDESLDTEKQSHLGQHSTETILTCSIQDDNL